MLYLYTCGETRFDNDWYFFLQTFSLNDTFFSDIQIHEVIFFFTLNPKYCFLGFIFQQYLDHTLTQECFINLALCFY